MVFLGPIISRVCKYCQFKQGVFGKKKKLYRKHHPCSLKGYESTDDAERKGRRGYSPKKGVAEAERAWCPAKGGTSEAEHRVAIFSLGKSTAYFRGEYPRQSRTR
jgi:hypothetical protein